jgi:5-bromo-4-chloroindolyl phosphate hydrolysis protein
MDEMERAHRNDYEYEKKLREARQALRAVLDAGRSMSSDRQQLVEGTVNVLTLEMDHIVARWN